MRRELLRASFSAAKASEGRVKELVWFTGKDVPRFDFWTGQEWILRMPMEKARLERLNNGAPLMKDHAWNRPVDNIVGVFEKAWIDGGIGKGIVRFAETADVEDIWQKVDSGIIQNVSMEAVVDDLEDVTPKGEKIKVLQATGWEVEAVSLVPVGADPDAGFMAAMSPMQHLAVPFAADKRPDFRLKLLEARNRNARERSAVNA